MFGDRFSSSTSCSKWRRETKPGRLDQSRSCYFLKVATHPIPSVLHCTAPYANNRVEVSHQPTRHRERQMRGLKSIAHLHRFASVHGVVQNLFRVGRHLLRAAHHRALRTRAFAEWNVVTCAA